MRDHGFAAELSLCIQRLQEHAAKLAQEPSATSPSPSVCVLYLVEDGEELQEVTILSPRPFARVIVQSGQEGSQLSLSRTESLGS